ncbi:hypothetical protein ZX61_04830 [Vibrio sp. VPAP30]|nr:flagellar hook-length control protein FliK [Vibrio sp. VPAP30]KLN66204.1 hypothetical protein ZX61_04830 [Vibrio sp. VPAP30]
MIDTSSVQTQPAKTVGKSNSIGGIHQARSFGQSTDTHRFELGGALAMEQNSALLWNVAQPEHSEQAAERNSDQEPPLLAYSPNGSPTDIEPLEETLAALQSVATAQQNQPRFIESKYPQTTAKTISEVSASTQSRQQNDLALLKAPTSTQAAELLSSPSVNQSLQNVLQTISHTASQPQLATATQPNALVTQSQGSEWAAVKVDTHAGKWGEQMMQVLHDRVSLQAQQSMQEAKIRLDPPELGKLDLLVRVEGDRLSVQINANATATREALMQVSDRLRAELQNQNFVHVDVNVGSGDSDQHRSPHQQEQEKHILSSATFSDTGTTTSDSSNTHSEHWLSTHA